MANSIWRRQSPVCMVTPRVIVGQRHGGKFDLHVFYNPEGFTCNLQAQNLNHELQMLACLGFCIGTIARKTVYNRIKQFKIKIWISILCPVEERFIGCTGIKGNILWWYFYNLFWKHFLQKFRVDCVKGVPYDLWRQK